jgi:hypothetical protein
MEAIRRIVTVKDNVLKVILPDHYNDKQVELIILPMEEDVSFRVNEERTDYFGKFYGKMKSSLSQDELDKKLNALREEWKRDTF